MHTQDSPKMRRARHSLLQLGLILPAAFTALHAQVVQHYLETPLTSNQASLAPTVDANLTNPWGLSRSSGGAWWVSDNGSGVSTLYDGTGKIVPLVVPIPPSDPASLTGTPTGTAFNGDPNAFPIAPGKAAVFLFVTEDGTISGWNPGVSPKAVVVVNNKEKSVFKGMTVAVADIEGTPRTLLYAADLRQGSILVFDSNFKPVHLRSYSDEDADDRDRHEGHEAGAFRDERLPAGYAPFNIQNIGGNLYVAFAKADGARHDEVDGSGNGYVDVFSPTGKLLLRLEHGPYLNAPWGLAQAGDDFGAYSHDVLVGQFGSGEILAFNPVTGKFKGKLMGGNNLPLAIDGLWALAFGNGAGAGPSTSLYFTAGTDHEQNGLFGKISAVENVQGNDN